MINTWHEGAIVSIISSNLTVLGICQFGNQKEGGFFLLNDGKWKEVKDMWYRKEIELIWNNKRQARQTLHCQHVVVSSGQVQKPLFSIIVDRKCKIIWFRVYFYTRDWLYDVECIFGYIEMDDFLMTNSWMM